MSESRDCDRLDGRIAGPIVVRCGRRAGRDRTRPKRQRFRLPAYLWWRWSRWCLWRDWRQVISTLDHLQRFWKIGKRASDFAIRPRRIVAEHFGGSVVLDDLTYGRLVAARLCRIEAREWSGNAAHVRMGRQIFQDYGICPDIRILVVAGVRG